ncbi:MAG: Probable metallo-hydrolase YflN, partial [uncultured Gemmatimonadetes bacterium]
GSAHDRSRSTRGQAPDHTGSLQPQQRQPGRGGAGSGLPDRRLREPVRGGRRGAGLDPGGQRPPRYGGVHALGHRAAARPARAAARHRAHARALRPRGLGVRAGGGVGRARVRAPAGAPLPHRPLGLSAPGPHDGRCHRADVARVSALRVRPGTPRAPAAGRRERSARARLEVAAHAGAHAWTRQSLPRLRPCADRRRCLRHDGHGLVDLAPDGAGGVGPSRGALHHRLGRGAAERGGARRAGAGRRRGGAWGPDARPRSRRRAARAGRALSGAATWPLRAQPGAGGRRRHHGIAPARPRPAAAAPCRRGRARGCRVRRGPAPRV